MISQRIFYGTSRNHVKFGKGLFRAPFFNAVIAGEHEYPKDEKASFETRNPVAVAVAFIERDSGSLAKRLRERPE